MFISSKNFIRESEYDETRSFTYKNNSIKQIQTQYNLYKTGLDSSESINFPFIFSVHKPFTQKISDINFILGTSLQNSARFYCGFGLKIPFYYSGEQKYGIMQQLCEKNIVKSMVFTVKYEDYREEFDYVERGGELIIGAYPHQYEKDTLRYGEERFKQINAMLSNLYIWELNFESIRYCFGESDCVSLSENSRVKLDINEGMILGNYGFKRKIFDLFFNEEIEKGNCELIKIKEEKEIITCNLNTKLINFYPLLFYNKDFNYTFKLTKYDLFKKIGNKYYFMIYFYHKYYYWVFGKPFLEKYQFTFNMDSKLIGFYERDFELNYKTKRFYYSKNIKITIGFGLLLLLLLLIFVYFRIKKDKKKYNIIEDNYEYSQCNSIK